MFSLFKKELLAEKNWIIGFSGFVLGINFLFLPLTKVTEGFMAMMVIFFTLPAFPLMALVRAFLTWKNEWDSNTNFLLLSLPVRGYNIVLSKVGALAVEIFLYVFLVFFIPYMMLTFFTDQFSVDFLTFSKLWFLTSFRILLIVPFAMFSYLFGRMFSKAQGWITAGSLVGLLVIYSRYLHLGRKLFTYLPEVSMRFILAGDIETLSFSIANMMASFLFCIILTLASCFFIEKAEL
jgi:ABC-type transport system involved in multi-copper enzyme maturation permease subunit